MQNSRKQRAFFGDGGGGVYGNRKLMDERAGVHYKKECAPGITLATLASLTAAACGALTGFVRSRPVVPGARLKLTQNARRVNVLRHALNAIAVHARVHCRYTVAVRVQAQLER